MSVVPPSILNELTNLLRTKVLGQGRLEHHQLIASTNTRAMDLALDNFPEGTLVWAESQSAGRGRWGRTWHSGPGASLSFSLILQPYPLNRPSLITLVAGLSVAEAIRQVTGYFPEIKWPNDLLINGKKMAGLLAELDSGTRPPRFVVLGIGLNVNLTAEDIPLELRDTAGSLLIATGKTWERIDLLAAILEKLEYYYLLLKENSREEIMSRYRQACITIGADVRVAQGPKVIEGRAVSVDHDGRLVIERTDSGQMELVEAGEVGLVRPV
ncbi:MAG: biotin--[acetyl-CoA-carboxylase] ligase [Deltaproteobacteria bacterium]|nr:biotin--[acetyl-CoA-carboxylase] ligase [Deltaproteobacteria bacterium]